MPSCKKNYLKKLKLPKKWRGAAKRMFQRIVIPKGTILNPNQSTIIEIPANLKDAELVVARPKSPSPPPGFPQEEVDWQRQRIAQLQQQYPDDTPPRPMYNMGLMDDTSDVAGVFAMLSPSPQSRASSPGGGVNEAMYVLDRIEEVELSKVQKNLRDFQTSRRNLVFDVASLAGGSDAAQAGLINSSTSSGTAGSRRYSEASGRSGSSWHTADVTAGSGGSGASNYYMCHN